MFRSSSQDNPQAMQTSESSPQMDCAFCLSGKMNAAALPICFAFQENDLLSVLYGVVYIGQSQSSSLSLHPLYPLVTIHLFSTSVALFPFYT